MLNGRQFCSHSRCFFYGISWQDFLWINHSCWLQAEMFDKFLCRRFSFGIGGLSYGWWGWGGHWRTFTSSRAVFRLRAKDQTRTQSLFCMRCDLWEGFSEFGVHQWKDGRKTRSDWQIKEIFLHKSIISCKHQYFTVFFALSGFLYIIDYLHGHPSSLEKKTMKQCFPSVNHITNNFQCKWHTSNWRAFCVRMRVSAERQ